MEWVGTEIEDERFLPTVEADASEIIDGLWLGSESNVLDLVWVKVVGIRTIITINSAPCAPLSVPGISESLKEWYKENVNHIYFEALDSPVQMVMQMFKPACELIQKAVRDKKKVIVHCGRGISRSATLVIAYLMQAKEISYPEALGLVSAKRACVYPNIGFQLQLCLFEAFGFKDVDHTFDIASEIAVSIRKTLNNIEQRLDAIFEDETARQDPLRWMDFGFFFQNCLEYLGHLDIGLPSHLLEKADDLSRRLSNLELVFEGPGIATAARLGRVMSHWQSLQARMATAPGALPRIDLSSFVSVFSAQQQALFTNAKKRKLDNGSDRSDINNAQEDGKASTSLSPPITSTRDSKRMQLPES